MCNTKNNHKRFLEFLLLNYLCKVAQSWTFKTGGLHNRLVHSGASGRKKEIWCIYF
jgi:hypothetical protein